MPAAREIIAIIVTLGTFALLGGYIFTGGHLDSGTGVALVAFTSGSLGSVLGFYFGKTNGAQTQLANSTTQLATQALTMASQRRTGDVLVPGVTTPAPPPPPMGNPG